MPGMGDFLRFDAERLKILVERHLLHTGSARAKSLLDNWDAALTKFVKVMPSDYAKALADIQARAAVAHRRRVRDMGKVTGFLEIERQDRTSEKPETRINNYKEFVQPLPYGDVGKQAARCMDCGIPFCHQGCPVNNQIPDWNHLVYRDQWRTASENLHTTNNFPEFTGRICPAPCEASCTLNIIDTPVTIKTIECQIVDRAWEEGWIQPQIAPKRPARRWRWWARAPPAWRRAQQLARAGHSVTLFEKADRIGGLLRYGIPDFKMEKHLIDRRVRQMEAEGVVFRANVEVGVNVSMDMLLADYDAVVLSGGAEAPRDLPIMGREMTGIHFAMDFLTQQNKRVAGDPESKAAPDGTLSAKGKHVVVIGGGDTGSDCVGTSNRHGAASVTQFEIMPQPPGEGKQDAGVAGLAAQAAHLLLAPGRLRARLGGADQARHR